MKKIYSVALILFSLWAPSMNAQNCPPGANAQAFIGFTSCYVSIQGALPNSEVTIQNANGQLISFLPAPVTTPQGNALVFYDCNSSPSVVNIVQSAGRACQILLGAPINLPIKIKTFTAQPQNDNSVILRWTSVLEANASKYVIQKSTDGRNFIDIAEVKAAGNSQTALNYSYLDRQMANGSAYYRLKLVDLDGTLDFTKIIYINNGKAGLLPLSVFPNPFRSEVQLKGVAASDVNRKNIKVYNAMGSEVNYRVVGGNSIVIDPTLPNGVYILRLKGEVFKLFKE